MKRRKGKAKGKKGKVDSKELEEFSLVKNMHTILNGGHKKIVLGGPKVREARKVFRKVKTASPKVVFALTNQKRVQAAIKTCTKAEARIKNERARKVLFLNLDFRPQKHPVKKDMAMPGNKAIVFSSLTNESSCSSLRGTTALYGTGRTAWMASVPLNLANHPTHVVLDLGCTRSIGSRAAIKRFL